MGSPLQTFAFVAIFSAGGMFLVHAQDADKDLEKMQGAWLVVALTEKGKAVSEMEVAELEVTVKKDVFTVAEKGKVIAQYQFKLDPAKTPKTIDFMHVIGEDRGKTELGIYAFDKETLKICLHEGKKTRPTGFAGDDYDVITLKRKPAK